VLKNFEPSLKTQKSWAAQFVSVLLGVRVSPSALGQAHPVLITCNFLKKLVKLLKHRFKPGLAVF